MTLMHKFLYVAALLAVTTIPNIPPARADPLPSPSTWSKPLAPSPTSPGPEGNLALPPTGVTRSMEPTALCEDPECLNVPSAHPTLTAIGPVPPPNIGPTVRPFSPASGQTTSDTLPETKETTSPDGQKCTWRTQNDRIVIDMMRMSGTSHWSQTAAGYTWRAGQLTESPDEPGSGELHITILPERSGIYYMTAVCTGDSLAQTRSSSFWLRFTGGLQFYDMKADLLMRYQASGGREYRTASVDLLEDGSVHCSPVLEGVVGRFAFVTYPLVGREFYQVVISGRSALFAVVKLVLVRCEGVSCHPRSDHILGALSNLNGSPCLLDLDDLVS